MASGEAAEGIGPELDRYSAAVEGRLDNYLSEEVEKAGEYHPFIREVYASIREFCLRGGKRIASYTVELVSRGYGVEPGTIDEICEAVELYRHSILIHDDLVDGDEQRRGKPTLHAEYSTKRDERFGLGCAVFAGNILFSLAIRRALDAGLDPAKIGRICGELARANRDVNESQILDLRLEGSTPEVSEWEVMATKRAGSLFGTTLRIGGLVSGAEDDLDKLRGAGEVMGFVFDIQDDIIDTFATRESYGRGPGSDLKTLKRPLHMILAIERAGHRGGNILENPDVSLEEVRSILIESGALKEAHRIADERSRRALDLISDTGMSRQAKADFESLMDYMGSSLEWYDAGGT